jgi:hypothetical protein
MLESEAKSEACEIIAFIAKSLPVNPGLVATVADIVESETDTEVLAVGFEAMAKLLRSHIEYIEIGRRLIEKVLKGKIKWMKGSIELLYDSPGSVTQYLLNFVAMFLRFHPSNADQICRFALDWIPKASQIVITSLLGLLTDAVLFCNISSDIIGSALEWFENIVISIDDTDLRHNLVAYLTALIGKIETERILPFLTPIAGWWAEGKAIAVGQDLLISNIALFILKFAVKGGPVDRAFVVECLSAFPPSDIKDTTEMATILIQLVERDTSVDLVTAVLLSVANLLTEPQARIRARKLQADILQRLQHLFKRFVSGQDEFKQTVLRSYDGHQEKQALISQYFV